MCALLPALLNGPVCISHPPCMASWHSCFISCPVSWGWLLSVPPLTGCSSVCHLAMSSALLPLAEEKALVNFVWKALVQLLHKRVLSNHIGLIR